MDPNRHLAKKATKPQPVRKQLDARRRAFDAKGLPVGAVTMPGSQNRNK